MESDRIFVRDGRLFSSAGVTAGLDLTLALIEEDFGSSLALAVARRMVMFLKRPGGQSQFSVQLAAQRATRSPIQQVQDWARDNLRANLSVPALSRRAAMSERNFARVFHRETGMTPAEFVEATRLDAARRLIEEAGLPLQRIALECGFASSDALRRAFLRRLKVTPQDYRSRFRSGAGEGGSEPAPG